MTTAPPLPYAPPQMHYAFLGNYALDEDFTVTLDGRTWTVPAGYRTDLASVPRIFWALIPPTGAYEIAAVLHDWMCSDGIAAGLVTSREADAVFRRLMAMAGVGPVRRWCMWAAVRLAAPWSAKRRPSGIFRDLPAVAAIAVALAVVVRFVAVGVHALFHLL